MPGPCLPPCLTAALEYLRRGWSVIPLCPPGHEEVSGAHEKSCARPGMQPLWDWQAYLQRRARPQEMNMLWSRNRHQNVGLVLGPVSGLVAVEIEGSAGEQVLQELSRGELPPTLEFTTPGLSRRLLYRWPEGGLPAPPENDTFGHLPVRLLGQGAYTVAPPSQHQVGGAYAWVKGHGPADLEPAPCPWWVLDFHGAQARRRTEDEGRRARAEGREVAGRPDLSGSPFAPRPSPLASRASLAMRFVDLERRPVVWLWQGWIPLGKLTLLDGDPGLGKSTLLLDLAARVSYKGVMADGSQGVRGHVVILSAEDGAEDTIRPRLEAAGAALEHIHGLAHAHEGNDERCLEIPRDLPLLEQHLAAVDARLLIIDPLAAFLCGRDANKDQAIRRVLYQLSRIAERRRCAVICMRHLNKTSAGKALYRGNMSIGVIGHARAGLLVAPDPDDAAARVLAVTKCNLAAPPASLRFRLTPSAEGEVCRIDWLGHSPYRADHLLQPPPAADQRETREEATTKLAVGVTLLGELLARGPQEIRLLKKECSAAGLSTRTVERAARRLGLRLRHTFLEGRNIYTWELPKS
jgi:AAA domain/Bifunctional DNA primase/polymerase, N-terminal